MLPDGAGAKSGAHKGRREYKEKEVADETVEAAIDLANAAVDELTEKASNVPKRGKAARKGKDGSPEVGQPSLIGWLRRS